MKNIQVLLQLVKRSTKIFIKDKAGVFFALFAPLIILVLYVLFLGDIQLTAIEQALEGVPIESKILKSFVDGWMLAGVVAVACLTVSFSAQNIMVADKENGVLNDTLVSPVNRAIVTVGYFIANYIITILICIVVAIIAFVYLAISGWYLSVVDVFGIIGMVLLSALSSCILSTIICKAIKTSNAHGAFVGIISAISGFLIGAYMPISMFPKAVQYFTLFIPGSYSASVLRNLFMRGALDEVALIAPQVSEVLKENFSLNLDFFGKTIGVNYQLLILSITIVFIGGIYLIYDLVVKKYGKRKSINLLKSKDK